MSFFSCDWILLIFLISRLRAEWPVHVPAIRAHACRRLGGRYGSEVGVAALKWLPFGGVRMTVALN